MDVGTNPAVTSAALGNNAEGGLVAECVHLSSFWYNMTPYGLRVHVSSIHFGPTVPIAGVLCTGHTVDSSNPAIP